MKMIKYCYCKTRPLKIPSVRGRDAPEQAAGLVEPLVTKRWHFSESCFYANFAFESRNRLPSLRSLLIFREYNKHRRCTDASRRSRKCSSLRERKLWNVKLSPLLQTRGPAGRHVPAAHLNCFTYMYIFIQLMPVQCIILPTRKINTHSSLFFF